MPLNSDRLKALIGEYTDSLTRMDGEKDHQNAIVAQAKEQCGIESGHFKRLGVAMHKGKLEDVYLDAGEIMALVDTLRMGEETE